MMIYTIISICCLSVLIIDFLFKLVNTLFRKGAKRITFLRSFKKGEYAVVYLTSIPLYYIGHIYAGQSGLNALFSAITKTVSLVVFGYDVDSIQGLMADNAIYNFTVYSCFFLVVINAVILTLSFTHQYLWSRVQEFKALMTQKDKLFIFGNNSENISIYLSDKKRNKVIIADISSTESERLYMDGISFVSTYSYEALIQKLFRLAKKFDREYIVVVNTQDDEENIKICRSIIKQIDLVPENTKERLFLKTKVFVFGDTRYEAVYADIVSSAFGCIHYVNKYQEIAIDFINKYPLSKFMDENQIDYEQSVIREGVDINVLFVGFGKTARQLFLTSVANNQFLTAGASDPELKPVKYFIFDKEQAENNKNLNHNYYRYKNECKGINQDDYLSLPQSPAEEIYYQLDINDSTFYNHIRNVVTANNKDVNFVVIAFGTDLENIDMAQKIVEKRKEWGVDNLVVFVKARGWSKEQTLLEDEKCYFIGNESEVVYNIDKIMGDRIFHMAQMRNEVYDLERLIKKSRGAVSEERIKQNHDEAYKNWYKAKTQMERESSIYCCLSLRSKLNLMGLDYCDVNENDEPKLSRDEYMEIYAGFDKPIIAKHNVKAIGKPIIEYTLNFPKSRRRNMAIHEHLRWNSFMISKGIIPATRQQILSEMKNNQEGVLEFTNGKNYEVRRHGNLTTFEGLEEFRRILANRDQCGELEKDVIKYDYQLLDDACWLLESNGYKIIRNKKLG